MTISNSLPFCSYQITLSLLDKFGLIMEYRKMEVFYFSRLHKAFNPPLLDLLAVGWLILWPKDTWKYLEYIFDRKLLFWQYINFYAIKVISTVKCMKVLGNFIWGLVPQQKHLLYRSCILSITLYRFQLWFYNKVPLLYPLKKLNKIQRKAVIWILGVFHTLPSFGIEAIASLIPIPLQLQKLSGRS